MSELFRAALAGAWTWVITYVFPASLALGLLAVAISDLEPASGLVREVRSWSAAYVTAAAVAAATFSGLILAGLNNGLHRVLEGYVLLPRWGWLWDHLRNHQLERKRKLGAAAENASGGTLRGALLREKAQDYPDDDAQVGPTRYGNSVRALETYAVTRFTLDSQYLWGQLTACAPESARAAEEEARGFVDFLVNLLVLSAALATGCLTYFIIDRDGWWLLWAGAFGASALVWKRLTYGAVRSWRSAVRAVVDLGRAPLADALNMQLPPSIAQERKMWQALVWASRDQHSDSIELLGRFRVHPRAIGDQQVGEAGLSQRGETA